MCYSHVHCDFWIPFNIQGVLTRSVCRVCWQKGRFPLLLWTRGGVYIQVSESCTLTRSDVQSLFFAPFPPHGVRSQHPPSSLSSRSQARQCFEWAAGWERRDKSALLSLASHMVMMQPQPAAGMRVVTSTTTGSSWTPQLPSWSPPEENSIRLGFCRFQKPTMAHQSSKKGRFRA